MFIYCFDDNLKTKLLNNGFKIFKGTAVKDGCVFIYDKKLKFDFNCIDKSKFIICNKLKF